MVGFCYLYADKSVGCITLRDKIVRNMDIKYEEED